MSGSTSAYGADIVAVRMLFDPLYVTLKLVEVSLRFDWNMGRRIFGRLLCKGNKYD
jgi:hypothetical protein